MKVVYPSETIYFLDTNSYQSVQPTGFLPNMMGMYIAQFENLPLYHVYPTHSETHKYIAVPRRIKGE